MKLNQFQKVLHGCDSDVEWLQRDFSVYLVNVFDTHQVSPKDFERIELKNYSMFKSCSYVSYWNSLDYHWPGFYRTSTTLVPIIIHVIQAGKLLEFPRLSLAWLLQNYCNLSGDKQFQLADWRIRLSAIHLDLSIILYLGRHFHKWLLSLIISS